jgi:DNA-binding SARP family transcriptional activator
MRFEVLGPLKVADEKGTEVRIRQPRERALLATMLLRANQVTRTDLLINLLWGDDVPRNGAGALRTHIWSLRRLLAPSTCLQNTGGGYLLRVAPGELDADDFRGMAEQGMLAVGSSDSRDVVLLLTRALQLWHEPALADVPPTRAMQAPARKLLEQRRAAHEALITTRLALGQHGDLLPELLDETSARPEDEWYWERLVLTLYRCGRRAEALDAFRRAQAILAQNYGIDLGPRLQQLHRQILTDDPALDWAARPPESGLPFR